MAGWWHPAAASASSVFQAVGPTLLAHLLTHFTLSCSALVYTAFMLVFILRTLPFFGSIQFAKNLETRRLELFETSDVT